jgi:aerobic carbon-monoxide dehydrogenase medium subunit
VVVHPASADADAVREAVRAADFDPPSDVHASSEYRRHLAGVLAVRAVEQAEGKAA